MGRHEALCDKLGDIFTFIEPKLGLSPGEKREWKELMKELVDISYMS